MKKQNFNICKIKSAQDSGWFPWWFEYIEPMLPSLELRGKTKRTLGFRQRKGEEIGDVIARVFLTDSSNRRLFDKALTEVLSGDGDEKRHILSCHSSSLCALLHFYDIARSARVPACDSTKNGFALAISKDPKGGSGSFYPQESHFEVKNAVFSRPSNIDVVLKGHYSSLGEVNEVELNLESKFLEWESLSQREEYSIEYLPYFEKYLSGIEGLQVSEENGKALLISSFPRYLTIFKQMIAHFIGLTKKPKTCQTWLGLVAYPFSGFPFDQGLEDYRILARRLNEGGGDVFVLEEPFYYDDDFIAPDLKARVYYQEFGALPFVGPFFFIDGTLFPHREKVHIYGDRFINADIGHDEFYEKLRKEGVEGALREEEYFFHPRGRVILDIEKGKYLVYFDRCLLKDEAKVEAVLRSYSIPVEDAIIGEDVHYQCHECQEAEL